MRKPARASSIYGDTTPTHSKVAWWTSLVLILAILVNCGAFVFGSLRKSMWVLQQKKCCWVIDTRGEGAWLLTDSLSPFLSLPVSQVPARRMPAARLRAGARHLLRGWVGGWMGG